MPRAGFGEVRDALPDVEFDVIGAGQRWPIDSPAFDLLHQTWARGADGVYVLDVFREPHEGETWIYRRDESLRRPIADGEAHSPTCSIRASLMSKLL